MVLLRAGDDCGCPYVMIGKAERLDYCGLVHIFSSVISQCASILVLEQHL